MIKGKFDHPITLSAILALFPKKIIDQFQWMVSPAIEMMHSLFLFFYVYFLTGRVFVALISQLVYSLTPMVLLESSQLSTRSIGALFFTLTWLPIMHFCITGSFLFFIIGVGMVILLTFTHRMSTQVLLLLSVLFLILRLSPFYLVISLSGILISWLCFGDTYKRILSGHLKLIWLWYRNIDKRYAHQVRGTSSEEEENTQTDFVRIIEKIFIKLPGVSLLAPNIWMAFLFVLPFISWSSIHSDPILFNIYLWAVFIFILAVLTSVVKKLRFIGSGERYIEYSSFPVAVVLGVFVGDLVTIPEFTGYENIVYLVLILSGVLGALIPAIVMQINVILKDDSRSITPALWTIIDELNAQEKNNEIRIACIPHQLADGILYFTQKLQVYVTDSNDAIDEFFKNWWPMIKLPLSTLLEEKKITHLLVNQNYCDLEEINIEYRIWKTQRPYVLMVHNSFDIH